MTNINRIILAGTVANNPQVEQIENRFKSVIKLKLVDKWKNSEGKTQKKVTSVNVICWGELAKNVSEFLYKGNQAMVEGRIQTEKGKTFINAASVMFLESSEQN